VYNGSMKKEKEIKDRILNAISKVEIMECSMCGDFIDKDEYARAEGVCFKHWDI